MADLQSVVEFGHWSNLNEKFKLSSVKNKNMFIKSWGIKVKLRDLISALYTVTHFEFGIGMVTQLGLKSDGGKIAFLHLRTHKIKHFNDIWIKCGSNERNLLKFTLKNYLKYQNFVTNKIENWN